MARRKSHKRRNPGVTLRRPLGALTAGFKPSALKDAAPIAFGALGNFLLRRKISSMLPVGWSGGIASYGVGLATAGAMLFVPRYGSRLFLGAVTEEALRAINQYIMKGGLNLNGMLGISDDDDGDIGEGTADYDTMRDYETMKDYDTGVVSDISDNW